MILTFFTCISIEIFYIDKLTVNCTSIKFFWTSSSLGTQSWMTIIHECSEIEIIVADITKTEKNREFRNISREVDENLQRVNIFINN